MSNKIYLRRRYKVALPPTENTGEPLPVATVAAMLKNLEALGYGMSETLIAACRALSLDQLTVLYAEIVGELRSGKGADKAFNPMYPNFPKQVMEMSRAQLYINAMVHYWSAGKLFPVSERKERFPLLDNTDLREIDLGSQADFETLFAQLVGANSSLSDTDKEDIRWFVEAYGDGIGALLPETVPQKETVSVLATWLLAYTSEPAPFLAHYVKTATDMLRLAVSLSAGDVSLAAATKFKAFPRPERRLLLTLLEAVPNPTEDMIRFKPRWIRLGEKLHPGEFGKRFPKSVKAFAVLRNSEPFETFNGAVETALAGRDIAGALAKLSTRAGELARRLDHLLRLGESTQTSVIAAFAAVAPDVSTPVLLQVRHHFATRPNAPALRVFFPKGIVAKAHGEPYNLPALPADVCNAVVSVCEAVLVNRFASLSPLGKVYVDPLLADYMVPFALRSASKSLRTVVRGSRLPLPEGDVLRFFLWWKNGNNGADITDIDLSAVLLNEAFEQVDVLSYYNLSNYGGCHSGDITDAPYGASEFIDITLSKVREAGVRYVVMSVNSYSQQPFVELPECFAGWMVRQAPESGEIYEPKTVSDKLDLTADTKIAVPVVFDIVERRAVWCDMALRSHPRFQNNVAGNIGGVRATVQSLVQISKPNLYDLLLLHAAARGELVNTPDDADMVFSVATETPFRLEEIASQYMA
ncbi:MAG: TerD family protein [Armatimonadetes bacterium]|nr:TerD family protein [Armatimonadota bacterium]